MPIYYRTALIAFSIVFFSCARVVNPTGGDNDTTPPELLNSIPKNYSTQFSGKILTLEFDEYIKLDNPTQNVIVAPLPKNKVQYKVKGKSIEVNFEEELLPNTTYSLFFGDAIKDNNESNPLANFTFVFSTGMELDSLQITGKVKYANSDKPAEKIKVLAYINLSDTAVLTSKPDYVSFTKSDGSYQFSNLPKKQFRIFALDDKNGNLYKDLPNEAFDFTDAPIESDSLAVNKTLRLYENTMALKRKKHTYYKGNVVGVNFNQEADADDKAFYSNDGQKLESIGNSTTSDSVLFSLSEPITDTIINPITNDSIAINFSDRDKAYPSTWTIEGNKVIWDSLFVISNTPFQPTDSLSVCGTKDSTTFCYDGTSHVEKISPSKYYIKQEVIDSLKKGGYLYFKSKSFNSLEPLEYASNDSIRFSLITPDSSSFGRLSITITNSSALNGFVVLKSETEELVRVEISDNKNSVVLKSPVLLPAPYTLLFVKDDNNDGKWNPGEFSESKKLKAERTIDYPSEIKVRANWILDLDWDLQLSED